MTAELSHRCARRQSTFVRKLFFSASSTTSNSLAGHGDLAIISIQPWGSCPSYQAPTSCSAQRSHPAPWANPSYHRFVFKTTTVLPPSLVEVALIVRPQIHGLHGRMAMSQPCQVFGSSHPSFSKLASPKSEFQSGLYVDSCVPMC